MPANCSVDNKKSGWNAKVNDDWNPPDVVLETSLNYFSFIITVLAQSQYEW
jgi:hypothetical protein